jgi:hypothetical protein
MAAQIDRNDRVSASVQGFGDEMVAVAVFAKPMNQAYYRLCVLRGCPALSP